MKKVLVILGSPRIGETYKAAKIFEEKVKNYEEVQFDYIMLKDKNLGLCKGCFLCLTKGEKFCPLKDDLPEIFEMMKKADGIVMAAPVYSLQVPAIMKNLLDRLAFVFHRPCFFHKAFTAIVTEGVYGDSAVLKYFDEVAGFLGFNKCKGVGLTTPPGERLPEQQLAIEAKIDKAARDFSKVLNQARNPAPGFKELMIFRLVRATKPYIADECPADYEYFRDNGWLEAPYFYETRLGFVKVLFGSIMDKIGKLQGQKIEKDKARLNLGLGRKNHNDSLTQE